MKKKSIIHLFFAAMILVNSLTLVVSVGIPETGKNRMVSLVNTALQSTESLAKSALPLKQTDRNSEEDNNDGICGIRG